MDLSDAVSLIEKGVDKTTSQQWLDLGAGDGLFTKALASVITKPSTIIAVDLKISRSLETLSHPSHNIEFKKADFTDVGILPRQLNGVLMANALHFVKEKSLFLASLKSLYQQPGRLIVIEYDLAKPNPWVPYPIQQRDLEKLLRENGYVDVKLIGLRKSSLNNSMIYALSCELREH